MPNILKRIIILAPLLAVMGCGSSDLPVITQIPSAATAPFSLQRNISSTDGLVTFASTGAECGIDEREVATIVYLPKNGELGEGLIGCSVMRAPGMKTRGLAASSAQMYSRRTACITGPCGIEVSSTACVRSPANVGEEEEEELVGDDGVFGVHAGHASD